MNLIKKLANVILVFTFFSLYTFAHDIHKDVEKEDMASDIYSRDEMQRTPLHRAAAEGKTDLLKKLIQHGADTKTKDIYDSSPLHEAVLHGHKHAVTLLILNGADVNACRPDGTTPLHIARERGHKEIAELLLKNTAIDKQKVFPELKGDYLGQKPPGKVGVIFAPGIISKGESRDFMHGFFENGKLFITYRYPSGFKGNWTQYPVFLMKKNGEKWTPLYQSKLKGKPWFYNLESVSAGERMIFAWTKNLDGSGPKRELYLWSSTKTPAGWTKPIRFDAPINLGFDTWPSMSADKTLYFFSRRTNGKGGADIYMSIPENGEYKSVINLGRVINTKYIEEDPYIAPDGSYLLFDSDKPRGYGGFDLYISYRKADGSWTNPVNLGNEINTEFAENRSYVSPDGKYLFYTSNRTGNYDAYWVDAKIIGDLKPIELTVGDKK